MGIQCSCCERDKENPRDNTFLWLIPATELNGKPEQDTEQKPAAEAQNLEEPDAVTITVPAPTKTSDSGAALLKDVQDKLAALIGIFAKEHEDEIQKVNEKKRLQRRKSSSTSDFEHAVSQVSTPSSKRSSRCDSEEVVKPKPRRSKMVVPEFDESLDLEEDHVLQKLTTSGGRKRRGDRRRRT